MEIFNQFRIENVSLEYDLNWFTNEMNNSLELDQYYYMIFIKGLKLV